MKLVSELETQQIKSMIANYKAYGKIVGGRWSLEECERELAVRIPPRRSKTKAAVDIRKQSWIARPVPDRHVEALRVHVERMRDEVKHMKIKAVEFGANPDWPWINFISSAANFRGAENWSKNVEPRISEFEWERVRKLTDKDRATLLLTVPNPIYRHIVAGRLEKIYQSILAEGGPGKVRNRFNGSPSTEHWLAMLQTYPGIGPKYARNIAMDVYHPLIRNHFAVDSRLYDILWELVYDKPHFHAAEAIFRELAIRLNIDSWGLDRILFSQYKIILAELRHLNKPSILLSFEY